MFCAQIRAHDPRVELRNVAAVLSEPRMAVMHVEAGTCLYGQAGRGSSDAMFVELVMAIKGGPYARHG